MMTIHSITKSVSKLSLCALLPAALLASAPVRDQAATQREGVALVREVQDASFEILSRADRLKTYSRSFQISRGTHAVDLHGIRTAVNERLRPAMQKLEALQPQLPEWKQQNITTMIESALALAADVNNAILVKQDARTVPAAMNEEYKAFVSKVADHASALVRVSSAAGTYGAARLKAAEAGVSIPTE
jgi:hypothetical protein